jgi:hypothetical protein
MPWQAKDFAYGLVRPEGQGKGPALVGLAQAHLRVVC